MNAQIAFNTPDSIFLDSISVIELRLDFQRIGDSVKAILEHRNGGSDQVVVDSITVSKSVTARLRGDFDIVATGDSLQYILDGEPLRWIWNIKAKSAGRKYLYLSITTKVAAGEETIERSISAYERQILVSTPSAKPGAEVLAFLSDHLEFLWGAVVLPLYFLVRSWFRRRKRAKPDRKGS